MQNQSATILPSASFSAVIASWHLFILIRRAILVKREGRLLEGRKKVEKGGCHVVVMGGRGGIFVFMVWVIPASHTMDLWSSLPMVKA